MISIDWEAVRQRLPVYAYEYETLDAEGNHVSSIYWRPHEHKGETPPPNWSHIDYDESQPELWQKAVNAWVRDVLTANEKAVWLDLSNGHFSNTFRLGELLAVDPSAATVASVNTNWKLIVYRCETDPSFEFTHIMKIVTKAKEERE